MLVAHAALADAAAARADADATTLKNAQTFFRNAVDATQGLSNPS